MNKNVILKKQHINKKLFDHHLKTCIHWANICFLVNKYVKFLQNIT